MEKNNKGTLEFLATVATRPDTNSDIDQHIYSKEKLIMPITFCDPKHFITEKAIKEKIELPLPLYLPVERLAIKKATEVSELFQQFTREPTGTLKLVQEDIRKAQSGVIMDVLKQAGLSIIDGKGVVGLSLPVRIFENRSTIERISDLWGYAPYYLNKAVSSEPIERIRCVLSMIVAGLPHNLSQWKPFNPLLGETYSGILEDGTTIDSEHTSHHPPVTNYYIKNQNWKIHGRFCYNAEIKANKQNAFNEGWGTVEWADGYKIKFTQPMIQIGGTVMGSRDIKFIASACAVDELSGMKGVIKFAAEAKTGLSSWFLKSRYDTFKGSIYMYDKNIHNQTLALKWPKMVRNLGDMKDIAQEIEKIEGSWQENLKFGNEVYWDITEHLNKNCQKYPVGNPLPSDCRFREDILWMTYKDKNLAQNWKVKLEEQQRWDRAVRKKFVDDEQKEQKRRRSNQK